MDSEYNTSPTLFYPQPENQLSYFAGQQPIQSPVSQWNVSSDADFSILTQPPRPILSTRPSRKRSRDETDHEYIEAEPIDNNGNTVMEVIEEPIYGPGMTLLNPSTGNPISSAESQSGTWIEEKVEEQRAAENKRVEASRPILRPAKSSRLDITQLEPPNALASTPTVDIDPASVMLGVGWKVMTSTDEDMQKAIRGWARYIENHYPLNNVQIVSKSEGKEAFLVQSNEGYWLFKEDLDEGRLISTSWQGCVAGLTSVPMTFEGTGSIIAQQSPSPVREDSTLPVTAEVSSGMDLD